MNEANRTQNTIKNYNAVKKHRTHAQLHVPDPTLTRKLVHLATNNRASEIVEFIARPVDIACVASVPKRALERKHSTKMSVILGTALRKSRVMVHSAVVVNRVWGHAFL